MCSGSASINESTELKETNKGGGDAFTGKAKLKSFRLRRLRNGSWFEGPTAVSQASFCP